MSTLIILLAQSKIGATFEILSLLLGAAIIGFLTAWLYCKSVHARHIKAVEFETDELKKNIVNLDADKSNLQRSQRDKANELDTLIMEVRSLKALQSDAIHETDAMIFKNQRTEQGREKEPQTVSCRFYVSAVQRGA